MSEEDNSGCGGCLIGLIELIMTPLTAIEGYLIHHSIFWAILDCIFWPVAWMKWWIFNQIIF